MNARKIPAVLREHYWLVAGQVHFNIGDESLHRNLNCLIRTDRQMFNHANMAKSQQLLQMRMINETFQDNLPEGYTVTDVFILSVNHLGVMTAAEYQEGFDAVVTDAETLTQKLDKERQARS